MSAYRPPPGVSQLSGASVAGIGQRTWSEPPSGAIKVNTPVTGSSVPFR
ncbi:hypothetical protein ACQEVS_17765 [Streptomyces sp. CA-181903]